MSKKNTYILLLLLGTAFWGISFPVTKMAIGENAQSVFLFYRFLLASVAVSIVFSKQLRHINTDAIKAGIALAIPLSMGIYLQTSGIRLTSASQAAFIAGTCVIAVPLLKVLLYKTVAAFKVWAAAALALFGLGIIWFSMDFQIQIGDVYTLVGAFVFGFYLIRVEYFSRKLNIAATLVPMFASCAFFMLLFSLPDANAVWLPPESGFWVGVVFCSVFSTTFTYSISNLSQKYLSAEKVSVIYLLEPVFAGIAAFFILDEKLTIRLLIGGSLIVLAAALSEIQPGKWNRKSKKRSGICSSAANEL